MSSPPFPRTWGKELGLHPDSEKTGAVLWGSLAKTGRASVLKYFDKERSGRCVTSISTRGGRVSQSHGGGPYLSLKV